MIHGKDILVDYKGNLVQECARLSTAARCVRRIAERHGGNFSDIVVIWNDWKLHEMSGEKFIELVDSNEIPPE